ncbi:MAG TPA: MauE/DoxX family redox-associated membrane protein [Candidatus Polarisedimenticolia bacterium]|nr:MauE/DoxX family redox-associated membrane protein [Candidatus Polarisedimenticolia bacterium]
MEGGRARRVLAALLGLGLGAIFLWAGLLKGLDPEGFGREIGQYGLLRGWAAQAFAYILIPAEVALGAALIAGYRRRAAFGAAAALLAVFMAAIGFALATGQELQGCGCFGRNVQRTPQQTLLEDGVFLAAALAGLALGGLRRGRPEQAEKRWGWRAATVAAAGIASTAFALASPHLPIDDQVTALRPGVMWSELNVALAEEDLGRGARLVALLGMKDEASAGALPALNALQSSGTASVVGLYDEDESAYAEFLWTRGPAFPLYNVSPSDMRRLYRRLPRFFAVKDGRVAATWDELPSAERIRAALQAAEAQGGSEG